MTSYRQQILENLAGRLLQIPGVTKVQPWRKNPYSVVELPAICWRDEVTKLTAEEFGRGDIYRLRVIFAAYCVGQTASSVARELMAEMVAAVGKDVKCGGLAKRVELNRATLAMGQKADIVAGARIDLTVLYYPANVAQEEPITDSTLTASGEILTSDGETLEW